MNLKVWQRNIVTESGNIIPDAEIEVFKAGTSNKPDLFSDADGNTQITNPFNATATGFARFYVVAGMYDIAVNGSVIWQNVALGLDTNDLAQNGGTVPEVDQDFEWDNIQNYFKVRRYQVWSKDDVGIRLTKEITPISEIPFSNWADTDTTHIIRYRLGGSIASENLRGWAITHLDEEYLIAVGRDGIIAGNVDFQGGGTVNAEELYEDGRRVVESDSNSDGEFTRWADGTVICAKQLELDTGITGNNTISDTPVPLTGNQFAGLSARSSFNIEAEAMPTMVIMIDENTWRIRQTDNSKAVSGTQTATLFAKGRWF